MKRLVLRKSKTGFGVAGLFLFTFLALLAWLYLIASKNPADSGESGILLLPFAMPWVMWLPVEWLGLWAAFLCVSLNALIVYCLFGGLRFRKKT
jgi:uncharacterized membrane protein YhaH (DUF805 family)